LPRRFCSCNEPEARDGIGRGKRNDLAARAQAGNGIGAEEQRARIGASRAAALARGKPIGTIAAARQIAGQEREAIIAENPLLAEYLA
jgi:hypothetical protein